MRWGNAEIPVGCVIRMQRDFLEAKIWEDHSEYGQRFVPRTFEGRQNFLICEFKLGSFSLVRSIHSGPQASGFPSSRQKEDWYVKLLSEDGQAVFWLGQSRSHLESWIKSKFVRLT